MSTGLRATERATGASKSQRLCSSAVYATWSCRFVLPHRRRSDHAGRNRRTYVTFRELSDTTSGAASARADLRISRRRDGKILLTSRQDSTIRTLVPGSSDTETRQARLMERLTMRGSLIGLLIIAGATVAAAQQPAAQQPAAAAQPQGFVAGTPLPVRPNVKTFGSFLAAESVTYDAASDRYVVVNTGVGNMVRANDGYISLLNPDGTVHTLKWIQPTMTNGVVLNDPRGSDIVNGVLYIADMDTVRMFDMATGAPRGSHTIMGTLLLNDLEVANDGTVYVTDSGSQDLATSAVYRITPQGQISKFIGTGLNRPNGIAFDNDGNIVLVQIGNNEVHTYSRDGMRLKVEMSTDPGNDGLVILRDGTKLISSVQRGTVARLRPNQPAEQIAQGIPNAASMDLDTKRNQLVIPQNQQNAVTIVQLQ